MYMYILLQDVIKNCTFLIIIMYHVGRKDSFLTTNGHTPVICSDVK